jgi:hypothetical protein
MNKDITLITLISSVDYLANSARSFAHNIRQGSFGESKLILKEMDYSLYNRWLIRELPNYVSTEFALITQWDSGIINPDLWTDSFLEYDYIGAPWPLEYGLPHRVGNGGFSLRSRKFLQESSKIADFCPIDSFIRQNEDYFLCVSAYSHLSAQGIKWAPLNVARSFSVERPSIDISVVPEDILSYRSFGFHGDFNVGGLKKIWQLD